MNPGDTAIEASVLIKILERGVSWIYQDDQPSQLGELLGALVLVAVLKKELRDESDDD